MISICIPVFNTNILLLVQQLSAQAAKASIPVEIVVLDDGSSAVIQNTNKDIQSITSVIYKFQPGNTGRIKSRMALAGFAKYPWLLFIDDDSKIIRDDFLSVYFQQLSDPDRVVTGGRKYQNTAPTDCLYRLHWKYGNTREHRWQTINDNWQGFQSNNFLMHKMVFDALSFPEKMAEYGHEDTWIGIQLEKEGKKILHIDNPVLHDRLESTGSFIKKSESAIRNLLVLKNITTDELLARHIKLYSTYKKIKRLKIIFLFRFIYSLLSKRIEKNVHGCDPSLFYFDLYRMNYLIKISR